MHIHLKLCISALTVLLFMPGEVSVANQLPLSSPVAVYSASPVGSPQDDRISLSGKSHLIPETKMIRPDLFVDGGFDQEIFGTDPEGSFSVAESNAGEGNSGKETVEVDSVDTESIAVNDLPQLSIASMGNGIVGEGESAVFIVSAIANRNPGRLDLDYTLSESGGFINVSGHVPKPLQFAASGTSGIYISRIEIDIADNASVSDRGSVSVVLNESAGASDGYSLIPGSATALNVIRDNDAPELSIIESGPYTEGIDSHAVFAVKAHILPAVNPLEIHYRVVSDSETYLEHAEGVVSKQVIEFSGDESGVFTAPLRLAIRDNSEKDESDRKGTVSVAILNNADLPVSESQYRISTDSSENTASADVRDDEWLPTVSIIASPGAVNPGVDSEAASKFTFIAEYDSNPETLTVFYEIVETGGDLFGGDSPFSGSTEFTFVASVEEENNDFESAFPEDAIPLALTLASVTEPVSDSAPEQVVEPEPIEELEVSLVPEDDSSSESSQGLEIAQDTDTVPDVEPANSVTVSLVYDPDAPPLYKIKEGSGSATVVAIYGGEEDGEFNSALLDAEGGPDSYPEGPPSDYDPASYSGDPPPDYGEPPSDYDPDSYSGGPPDDYGSPPDDYGGGYDDYGGGYDDYGGGYDDYGGGYDDYGGEYDEYGGGYEDYGDYPGEPSSDYGYDEYGDYPEGPPSDYDYGDNPEGPPSDSETDTGYKPHITIASLHSKPIVEGSEIQFELVSTDQTSVTVLVQVNESRRGLLVNGSESIQISFNDRNKVKFSLKTVHNTKVLNTGIVTAEIVPSEEYTVSEGTSFNSASVEISEDETLPTIRVEHVIPEVTEGTDAQFRILASVPNSVEVTFNVEVTGYFIPDLGASNVVFNENNEMLVRIKTVDDDIVEPDGEVALVLKRGFEYEIERGNDRALVKIRDNDISVLSIGASSLFATEGTAVEFQAFARSPILKGFSARIAIVDGGEDTNKVEYRTVRFQEGDRESSVATYFVPKYELYDFNRSVNARILPEDEFELSPYDSSVTLFVLGQSLPVINIEPVQNDPIPEGTTVQFRLISLFENAENLRIKLLVDDFGQGLLLGKFETTVVLPAGQKEVLFEVKTTDDLIDREDAAITAELLVDKGYNLSDRAWEHSSAVFVYDNDIPVISIAGESEFNEGDSEQQGPLIFTVRANIERNKSEIDFLNRELTIRYSVGQGDANFIDANLIGNGEVTLPAGGVEETATISIAVIDDEIDEANGQVTVTLLEDANEYSESYEVSQVHSSVTVELMDNDIPEISIVKVDDVVEGPNVNAQFTVSSDIERDVERTIGYSVNQMGSFLEPMEDGTVILPIGDNTVTGMISLPIADDLINEMDGSVEVILKRELMDPKEYTVHNVKNKATVSITDGDLPKISIALPKDEEGNSISNYIEGDKVTLTISADPVPWQDIEVTASLSPFNFIDIESYQDEMMPDKPVMPTETVTIPAGGNTGQITVQTHDDMVVDGNGILKVTIVEGKGYVPVPDLTAEDETIPVREATINVTDSGQEGDVPVISIMAGSNVTEAEGQVEFIVSSDLDRSAGIEVNYLITPNDFIDPTVTLSDSVTLPAGKGGVESDSITATISVQLLSGDTDMDDETITVSLDDAKDTQVAYTISDTQRSASVTVTDESTSVPGNTGTAGAQQIYGIRFSPAMEFADVTPLPVVSISAKTESVKEEETAVFLISLQEPVANDFVVYFDMNQGGRFLTYGKQNQETYETEDFVIVAKGESEVELEMEIINDFEESGNGILTVMIRDEPTYVVNQESSSASIEVIDIEKLQRMQGYKEATNAIVPDLLIAMGENLIETITANTKTAHGERNATGERTFSFTGQTSIQDILQYKARDLTDSTYSWESLLEDSSFRFPLVIGTESDITLSVWGSGDYSLVSEFGYDDEDVSRFGELYAAHLGFDTTYQNGLLVGVSTTFFESELEYTTGSFQEGNFKIQQSGLNPYFGWGTDDKGFQIWSTVGFGQGRIEIDKQEKNRESMDAFYQMLAIGTNNSIYSTELGFFGGQIDFNLKSEAWTTGQSLRNGTGGLDDADFAVHRVRFAADTINTISLDSGDSIGTGGSAGMRWDGGTNQKGFGLELGLDLSYDAFWGMSVESNGRILMSRSDPFREWGLSGDLQLDTDSDSKGIIVSMSPSWGAVNAGGVEQLWETGVFDDVEDFGSDSSNAELDLEVGYGFEVLDHTGVITPFCGATFYESGEHEYKYGGRLTLGNNFNLTVENSLYPSYEGDLTDNVSSNVRYSW